MKKARWFVFAGVTIGLLLFLYFSEGSSYTGSDVQGRIEFVCHRLSSVFGDLKVGYLLLAIFFQLSCTFNNAFSKHYLRRKYQKVPYLYTVHSAFFGISIGALLPGFLSAGEVGEISIMKSQGLDVHKSSSISLARQIAYFISICFLPLAFILANLGYFKLHSPLILTIFYCTGLFINLLTIFFYAFIARANNFLFKLAKIVINILAVIRIVKDKEKALNSTKNTLDSLKEQMMNLPLSWYDWLFLIFATSANIILGNLVSFCAALSLGIKLNGTFAQMIACTGFVTTVQANLPVPSGIGIADLTYKNIMEPLVGKDNINYLLLLWRIINFYIPIIISVIVMAFPIPGKKLRAKSVCDSDNLDKAE